MKNGEYESTEQMDADLNLMFENAKRYNVPNSNIYKRAHRLQQILQVSLAAFSSLSVRLCLFDTIFLNLCISSAVNGVSAKLCGDEGESVSCLSVDYLSVVCCR